MHLNARGGVSIAELVVFGPEFCIAVAICLRHGFGRSSGWIYTLILCVVRIVGACCQLATYSDQSAGLIKATIIIDSIGLSPLLLATLGLLSRAADSLNRYTQTLSLKQFRVTQMIITLGLILSIAGGSNGSTSNDGQVHVSTTSKAGIGLYVAGYVLCIFICIVCVSNIKSIETGEKKVLAAVLLALPLILVRLAYAALVVFVHNHDFNVIDGSVPLFVVMSFLEEFLVVAIYLLLGWKTETLTPDRTGPIASRPWKERGQQGGR